MNRKFLLAVLAVMVLVAALSQFLFPAPVGSDPVKAEMETTHLNAIYPNASITYMDKNILGVVDVKRKIAALETYLDAGATNTALGLYFGELDIGVPSEPVTVYVKNIGDIDFSAVNIQMTSSSISDYTVTPEGFPLAVGEIQAVNLTVTLASTSPDETHLFGIQLHGVQ